MHIKNKNNQALSSYNLYKKWNAIVIKIECSIKKIILFLEINNPKDVKKLYKPGVIELNSLNGICPFEKA